MVVDVYLKMEFPKHFKLIDFKIKYFKSIINYSCNMPITLLMLCLSDTRAV